MLMYTLYSYAAQTLTTGRGTPAIMIHNQIQEEVNNQKKFRNFIDSIVNKKNSVDGLLALQFELLVMTISFSSSDAPGTAETSDSPLPIIHLSHFIVFLA